MLQTPLGTDKLNNFNFVLEATKRNIIFQYCFLLPSDVPHDIFS